MHEEDAHVAACLHAVQSTDEGWRNAHAGGWHMDQCEDGPGQFLKDFRYHVLLFPNETPRAAIAIAAKAGLMTATTSKARMASNG